MGYNRKTIETILQLAWENPKADDHIKCRIRLITNHLQDYDEKNGGIAQEIAIMPVATGEHSPLGGKSDEKDQNHRR
jgi:hypothetical protein